jgi:uncharacterized lipoprotein YddW (UPF0748 family)
MLDSPGRWWYIRSVTLNQINETLHTRLVIVALLLIPIALTAGGMHSRPPLPPKREVRAVWVTTTSGLDWPRTTDVKEQQSSLHDIVSVLRSAGFNTIFFQARARGDAYYRSSLEPWAENLTGTLGKNPGWDPLRFLLDDAHAVGMEVHAWVNVFKVRSSATIPQSTPSHISSLHPEWTVQYRGEGWLDPGIPAVQSYLLSVFVDLVTHYDIDGINFDYLRYPGRDFNDADTYRRYGKGTGKDAWRKKNLDSFVAESYDKLTSLRPDLKVGSSPLGLYTKEDDPSSGAVFNFYQDAPAWLKAGKMDYVAPQLYWNIGSSRGDPDFAELIRGWQQRSAGRQVYAGIAAYRAEVARELQAQIDTARAVSAAGESFFRYENISHVALLGNRYETLSLVPPMPWKDPNPPLPPPLVAVTEMSTNVFQVEWLPPRDTFGNGPLARFVIYRSTTPEIPFGDPRAIITEIPAFTKVFYDTIRIPTSTTYYYAVSSVDRAGNESFPSRVSGETAQEFLALKGKLSEPTALSAILPLGRGAPRLVAYSLASTTHVSLELLAHISEGVDSLVTPLVNTMQERGTYVVGMNGVPFEPRRYLVRLRTADGILDQSFDLSR